MTDPTPINPSSPEPTTDIRLDAARDALITSLAGHDVQDALTGVSQQLGQLGLQVLNDRLNVLSAAVHINRAEMASAWRAWEDAFRDHMQVLLPEQAARERQQDRRIDVLDSLMLGSPGPSPSRETPAPGNDDPDESHP